jgi:ArsR family transcriptional regulator
MSLREKAELMRLLGHPTRLAIIRKLSDGPRCVTDIQELLDVPQANISQHLTALRAMRIVDFHEDGKLRCYYLARPKLATLVGQFLSEEYSVVERSRDSVRRASRRQTTIAECAS